MKLTEEQMKTLAPYADEMRRAMDSNYAKNPGSKALDEIRAVIMAATGERHYPKNWGCPSCVINTLKDAGRLYFSDLVEHAAQVEAGKQTAASKPAPAKKGAKTGAKKSGGKTPAKSAKTEESKPQAAK